MALHVLENGICTSCTNVRRFDPAEPRDPHTGKWGHGSSAVKDALKDASSEHGALAAPPADLAKLTAAHDPRAAALWFRTGDNSLETKGMPGFVDLNQHMREGGYSAKMDERVADIDSVMRESKLPHPIDVYRGVDVYGLGKTPGALHGTEFTDKAFASTTADKAWAESFSKSVIRIRVPAGVSAIRMADRDPSTPESEILLDRDLTYRITGEHLVTNPDGSIASHEIDAEVVGPRAVA